MNGKKAKMKNGKKKNGKHKLLNQNFNFSFKIIPSDFELTFKNR